MRVFIFQILYGWLINKHLAHFTVAALKAIDNSTFRNKGFTFQVLQANMILTATNFNKEIMAVNNEVSLFLK